MTALTLVITAVNGVPPFLALRTRAPTVLFETTYSQMVYPAGANRAAIASALHQNGLPDAFARLGLSNRGDERADEVTVTVSTPGKIIAIRTSPGATDKPAWVSIVRDSTIRDSTRARYSLRGLAIGPTLSVELSYISTADTAPNWEVYADGRPGTVVASLAASPKNVNKISFRPALRVLVLGLIASLLVFILIRSFENTVYREAVLIVLRATLPFALSG
jgi:hypothetical protein